MPILLVEDDAALGSAVHDYLVRASYAVDWVQRLAAARACLPGDFAAVVLDLGLPDGDGLDLLPALRDCPSPPPVLVLTARDRLSDRIRGRDAGADDYLVKPFDLAELAARSRRKLGRDAIRTVRGVGYRWGTAGTGPGSVETG